MPAEQRKSGKYTLDRPAMTAAERYAYKSLPESLRRRKESVDDTVVRILEVLDLVKEVGEETVKMDFNHPMAGKTLNFDVEIVSVRDVTPEDLQGGCSCGECGDDCGGGCDHEKGHCDCH